MLIFSAIGFFGCSGSGAVAPGGEGGRASGTGGSATGSGTGGRSAAQSAGGAAAKGGSTGSPTGGAPAGVGGATPGGASGQGGGSSEVGVCGQRGKAIANVTSYDGFEEFFMIADEGMGDDICVVRFDVKRVGPAPIPCAECRWTHLVEYSNPLVVTDVDGVCANSGRGLNAMAIAGIDGSRVPIGFVQELDGAHGSARMRFFEATNSWNLYGNATWDETADAFRYDNRDDICSY